MDVRLNPVDPILLKTLVAIERLPPVMKSAYSSTAAGTKLKLLEDRALDVPNGAHLGALHTPHANGPGRGSAIR